VRSELRRRGDVLVLVWPGLDELGVDAAVTTRGGGVSDGCYRSLNLGMHVGDDEAAVVENRRRAAASVGADIADLVLGRQVHGTTATVVVDTDAGRGSTDPGLAIPATDALVTASPRPVLVTLVADCSPILLVDPGARVLATVHAGWRGALAPDGGTVGETVRVMAELGAQPERTVAVIGPTVAPDHYEVGAEVVGAARAALGAAADEVVVPDGAKWRFDVAGANRLRLLQAGLRDDNVHRDPAATGEAHFYSDRMERPCGRFGLLARLRVA